MLYVPKTLNVGALYNTASQWLQPQGTEGIAVKMLTK